MDANSGYGTRLRLAVDATATHGALPAVYGTGDVQGMADQVSELLRAEIDPLKVREVAVIVPAGPGARSP